MSGLVALCGQIFRVMRGGRGQHAMSRYDCKPSLFQRCNLMGIVSHQPNGSVAKFFQHCSGEAVTALILSEAQQFVGVVSVKSLVLQAVGSKLVRNAVSAPFLVEIEQNAAAIFAHSLHRAAQLLAAIAAKTAEKVAGEAGRMNTRQYRALGRRVAHDYSDLISEAIAAPEYHELAIAGSFQWN